METPREAQLRRFFREVYMIRAFFVLENN